MLNTICQLSGLDAWAFSVSSFLSYFSSFLLFPELLHCCLPENPVWHPILRYPGKSQHYPRRRTLVWLVYQGVWGTGLSWAWAWYFRGPMGPDSILSLLDSSKLPSSCEHSRGLVWWFEVCPASRTGGISEGSGICLWPSGTIRGRRGGWVCGSLWVKS